MAAGTFHLHRRVRTGMHVLTAGVARLNTKQVKRRGAVLLALLVPMSLALGTMPASANTGSVTVGQNCHTWHASVALNHNVLSNRTVDVVTTIPGTMGIHHRHYDTSFGPIWSVGGPAPTSGRVTLNVYFPNGRREFTETKALPAAESCVTTTSGTQAPETTMAPTTTTTIVTQGSTETTSPSLRGSTAPESTTVFAEGIAAAPSSTTSVPSVVAPSGQVLAAEAANSLPRTGGGGGAGPVIGLASLVGGAVMLLVSRRHRRGRAA